MAVGGGDPVGDGRVQRPGGRRRGVADRDQHEGPDADQDPVASRGVPDQPRPAPVQVPVIAAAPPTGSRSRGRRRGTAPPGSAACWSGRVRRPGSAPRARPGSPSGSTVQLTVLPVDGDVVHARRRRSGRAPVPDTSARTWLRRRWRRSASVPVSTVRPSRMIVTRSASRSTSLRMWLERSTVAPAAVRSATHSLKTSSISGSSPEVGSSRISSSASAANAATSATFCRLPLE